MEQIDEYKS